MSEGVLRTTRISFQPQKMDLLLNSAPAAIAQLGERQTEDLKVPGSIPGLGVLRRWCVMW